MQGGSRLLREGLDPGLILDITQWSMEFGLEVEAAPLGEEAQARMLADGPVTRVACPRKIDLSKDAPMEVSISGRTKRQTAKQTAKAASTRRASRLARSSLRDLRIPAAQRVDEPPNMIATTFVAKSKAAP